ncbi:11892_t:CDS:1, partial [Dentiscutata erythropus]
EFMYLRTTFEFKNSLPLILHNESSINRENSLINSDTWIDDYKKQIRSPADHYEIKPTVPDSLDPEK